MQAVSRASPNTPKLLLLALPIAYCVLLSSRTSFLLLLVPTRRTHGSNTDHHATLHGDPRFTGEASPLGVYLEVFRSSSRLVPGLRVFVSPTHVILRSL